jgi:hypothetical protein
MRKLLIFIILAGIFLYPEVPFTDARKSNIEINSLDHAGGTYRYANRQILTQPKGHVNLNELQGMLSQYSSYIQDVDCLTRYGFAAVIVPEYMDVLRVINGLKNNPLIEHATLNYGRSPGRSRWRTPIHGAFSTGRRSMTRCGRSSGKRAVTGESV